MQFCGTNFHELCKRISCFSRFYLHGNFITTEISHYTVKTEFVMHRCTFLENKFGLAKLTSLFPHKYTVLYMYILHLCVFLCSSRIRMTYLGYNTRIKVGITFVIISAYLVSIPQTICGIPYLQISDDAIKVHKH